MIGTRINIQFTVNRLSQYLSEPRRVYLAVLYHLLCYLYQTIRYAIIYKPGTKGSNNKLVRFADASYGNARDHRLTSGYVFIIAGGPVSWMSRKQPLTALSTTEAEYIAAADAAKQVIWLWHFLYAVYKHRVYDNSPMKLQMSPKKLTELGIDNQGVLVIATNLVIHL